MQKYIAILCMCVLVADCSRQVWSNDMDRGVLQKHLTEVDVYSHAYQNPGVYAGRTADADAASRYHGLYQEDYRAYQAKQKQRDEALMGAR